MPNPRSSTRSVRPRAIVRTPRALAGLVDVFYIIGGKHSSNSIKLLAVCQEQCARSFLIETQDEIDPADLEGANRVGVTAGASTPNWLIDQVVNRLKEIGNQSNGHH